MNYKKELFLGGERDQPGLKSWMNTRMKLMAIWRMGRVRAGLRQSLGLVGLHYIHILRGMGKHNNIRFM
jgi:hypothetical protein